MQRFHVSIAVRDLQESLAFYRSLLGRDPDFERPDYAKWMLAEPALNLSLKQSGDRQGVSHVGFEVDEPGALASLRERYRAEGLMAHEQQDTECCYARSDKSWLRDPDGVAWETFLTHEQAGSESAHAPAAPGCCAADRAAAGACCG